MENTTRLLELNIIRNFFHSTNEFNGVLERRVRETCALLEDSIVTTPAAVIEGNFARASAAIPEDDSSPETFDRGGVSGELAGRISTEIICLR